jgi:hypothetical protein
VSEVLIDRELLHSLLMTADIVKQSDYSWQRDHDWNGFTPNGTMKTILPNGSGPVEMYVHVHRSTSGHSSLTITSRSWMAPIAGDCK